MADRILIVDDELDMLVLLKMILKEKTIYEVVTTPNPLEAEQLFREKPFHLVITDLKMPGMDGIELMGVLKKMDPLVPVIIITAFGSIESAGESTQKGAFEYITKPFRKEQIILSIEKALEFRRAQIEKIQSKNGKESEAWPAPETFTLPYEQAREKVLEHFKKHYFQKLLDRHQGNTRLAAEEAGLPEETLKEFARED